MGCDYYSYGIIGVRLTAKEIFTPKLIKAFKHDCSQSFKFHPETGQSLWKTEYVLPDGKRWTDMYDDWGDLQFRVDDCGFDPKDQDSYVYIGHVLQHNDNNFATIGELSDISNTVAMKLSRYGWYQKNKMGLWITQFVGC